jgi:ATP-binding cassette subfamily F protein uup
MPVIDARDLEKSYGPRTILDGVTLTIEDGERVGLVGLNGSGKSTLARILAGIEAADDGTITRRREIRVGYLTQTPSFPEERSAREELLGGLERWREAKARFDDCVARCAAQTGAGFDAIGAELASHGDGADGNSGELSALLDQQARAQADVERLGGFDLDHRAERLLGQLDVPPDKSVWTLSGGEARRVALGRILLSAPELAILDEPTNHLDVETIEWLETTLAEEFAGALLLVTHDRAFLDRVAQRTAEIDQGKLYSYPGGYAAYVEARAERLEHAQRTEANRQNYLRHELSWLRRQPKARTGKQKARINRIHAAMADGPARRERELDLRTESTRLGKTILELAELSVAAPDGRTLVSGLDFTLTRGQRVGIVGPNGCGKTTLLRTITGDLEPAGGSVVRGKNTRFSFLSQTRDDLDGEATIRENVAAGRSSVTLGGQDVDVNGYLQRFSFRRIDYDRPVSSLSGGEKSRVALARLLVKPANLVVLDEPTNDLDVATIAALEALLTEFEGTALVVTHDRWFLDRVATQLLVFDDDTTVTLYPGNYSTYRALAAENRARREREAAEQAKALAKQGAAATRRDTSTEGEASDAKATKPRKLTYAEEIELGQLEPQIEAADVRVSELEAQVADPALYERGRQQEAAEASAELERARAEATRLLARWEELETIREASS